MNPLAEQGFAKGAQSYARARPSYPREAVEWAKARLGLGAASEVLDLGAGTGKLTALLDGFARVVAVEPVAQMRAELSSLSFVEARDGTAEAIPARDGEFDAVFCAQAFHWFATPAVLGEIHRVVRPSGGLALLWNKWDRRVRWADALKTLTAPYDALRPQYELGHWKAAFQNQGLFGPLAEKAFEYRHSLPREDVLTRMGSTSSIALLDAQTKDALFRELRSVLENDPDTQGRATLDVPYITEVFVTQRR